MAGTVQSGKRAYQTNIRLHGKDFYKKMGHLGGIVSHPESRPFSTNPELASKAGRKGGMTSRRKSKAAGIE